MKIIKLDEFNKWYKKLDLTKKTEVDVRLTRILIDSNFGNFKNFGKIRELEN